MDESGPEWGSDVVIAEPLGSYWYLLVEDGDGVWWWGNGYPGETP
jgi:hypothetical protein